MWIYSNTHCILQTLTRGDLLCRVSLELLTKSVQVVIPFRALFYLYPVLLLDLGVLISPIPCTLTKKFPCISAIISADRYSRSFEASRNPEDQYRDSASKALAEANKQQTPLERFYAFGRENRYPIVGVSWVASMGIALAIVGRSPYLTTPQKLVQARVYAQGLTLAVLLITAIFEVGDRGKGEGRWETVQVLDENDPTHQHLIEKRIHHESYRGEDQWRGTPTFTNH